ncbi:MAG: tetratricopeptide repeat protein [Promethearchaeota archaeon]
MSFSPPNELINAKKMIVEGNHESALKLLIDFQGREGHDIQKILMCELLKCELLFQQGLYEELLSLAKQAYNDSLELGASLLSLDFLLWKSRALMALFKVDDVPNIITQGEVLLRKLKQEQTAEYKKREATIAFIKGLFYFWQKRDADLALEQLNHSLALREKFGVTTETISTYLQITKVLLYGKGEFDRAFNYLEHGMTLAKEINNKFNMAWYFQMIAVLYGFKGEIDKCVQMNEQSLKLYRELNNKPRIADILNNMGDSYRIKGDLDLSLDFAKQSLTIRSESGTIRDLVVIHFSLFQTFIEKGDLGQAQKCLDDAGQLIIQLEDKHINRWYLCFKSMLLKKSLQARKRVKAEEILTKIIQEEVSDFEMIVTALLNLCELYLNELEITNEIEILEKVRLLITQLLDIAEKSRSYWIWGEIFLLQAKLELLSLNLKEARRFLTQGQKLAEKYGLESLVMKISNEHDELLKKIAMWEELKELETSLSERMKFARLDQQIENMVKRKAFNVPELSEEESIFFLIVSEGGMPFFSYSFIEDQAFKDHLFGGFLTAINTFINEMFSEGLDRASFGKHTLLMNSVSPFLMCYIYKGQSYTAQKRLKAFINELKGNNDVWNSFTELFHANRKLQLSDIPFLIHLIKEIFIEKKLKD